MGKDELRVAEETILPNEDAVIDEFVEFLKRASERRHPSGELRRFNQPRHAGCAHAQLIVSDDLAAELKVGVFARPGAYDARVRFASASPGTDRDRDIRGMSIRFEGVPGSNLTAGATTQDFILNSHPVMVARDTREFLGLLRAADAGGVRRILYFRLPDRIYGCNWFYEGQFTLLARRNVRSFRAVASAERCSVCVA